MPNTLSSSEYTYTAVDLYTLLYCILRSWVSTKAVKTLSGKQILKAYTTVSSELVWGKNTRHGFFYRALFLGYIMAHAG